MSNTESIIDGWPPEGPDVQKQQVAPVGIPGRTNDELWSAARAAATDNAAPAPTSDLGALAEVHDGGYIVEIRDPDGNLIETDYSNVGPNVWLRRHAWEPWELL